MLRTSSAIGGRTAFKALAARATTSTFPSSRKVCNIGEAFPDNVCLKFLLRTKTRLVQLSNPIHWGGTQVAYKSTAVPHETENPREDYNVSQTVEGTDACLKVGISTLGITGPATIYRNLAFQELFDHEVANEEGKVANAEYGDTFAVDTGKFTGRSPKDKWIVLNKGSESAENIDWNNINQATTPEVFDELYDKAVNYFNTRETAYVFDGYCGSSPKSQRKIRFVHEMAWQQHFVSNMFIRPETDAELENFDPDFTVINCCSQVDEDWERHGLNSDTAVVFNIEKKTAVIFGTWYGGENKKGIFSLMNYWLPMAGDFPMHCSANVGIDGDSALFFGLSGTGKVRSARYCVL